MLFAAVLKEKSRPSDNTTVYDVLLSGGEGIARSVSADLITRIQVSQGTHPVSKLGQVRMFVVLRN